MLRTKSSSRHSRTHKLAVKDQEIVPSGPLCSAGGCEPTIGTEEAPRIDILHRISRDVTRRDAMRIVSYDEP